MIKSFILCAVFLLGMIGKTYAGTAKYTTITPPGRSSIVTSITGLLDVEETSGCQHFTVEGVIKSVDKGGFSLFVKESPFQKRDGSMTLYVNLGCPNRLLSVDRFLDSRCQSRLSSAW